MAIQIVDNFQVNNTIPLDNRFVVGPSSFYTDKSNIPNKYAGLRVWDLTGGSPGVPYVWDGSAWQSESSSGISGNGTDTFIPKFISGGGVIDDSIIREVSGNVGIGVSPTKKLHVSGDVKSDGSGGYYGIGTNLTNLNATNITTGSLTLTRLVNGTSGYIMTAGSGSPTWTNPNSITVGNSTNTQNISHATDSSTSSYRRLLFINTSSSSGNNSVRTSNNLSIKPNTGELYTAGIGIATSPSSSYKLNVFGKSYLNGNVGIRMAPSSSYYLSIAGGSSSKNVNGKIWSNNQIRTDDWFSTGDAGTSAGIKFMSHSNANSYIYRYGSSNPSNDATVIRTDFSNSANWTGVFSFFSDGTAHKSSGPSWVNSSDKRLKTNIKSISKSLDKIKKLNAVEFNWKSNGKKDIGFIADDVQIHFPNWVTERKPINPDDIKYIGDDDMKLLSFPTEWNALILESIKELDARLKLIEDKIN